jgi:regulatory protein
MAFQRSKKSVDAAGLYEYAVQALGRRMRTVAELKRLLRQRNVEGDRDAAIEAVVLKLKEQRYLNDANFAATFSALRRDGNKFGSNRVTNDLRTKGVHGDVIAKAVTAAYSEVDEEKLAREFLSRKRIKKPIVGKRYDAASYKQAQKETARVFRLLVRAGFRAGVIIKILKNWDVAVDDEMLSALVEETEK